MKASLENRVSLLSQIDLFARLPGDAVMDAAKNMTERSYPEGRILSVQDRSPIDCMLIVTAGSLETHYERNGKKMMRETVGKGEILGGISILMNAGVANRTVAVKSAATVYALGKTKFLDLCSRYPAVYDHFAHAFSKQKADAANASIWATDQAARLLSGILPFSFLPEREIASIAGQLTTAYYPKDTVMFLQDRSRLNAVYIVRKGALKRYYERRDRQILSGLLGEGDILGGISVLLNDAVSARTVKTLEDTYVYVLSARRFLDVCRRHEAVSDFFTDAFGKRMLDRSYAEIFRKSLPGKDDTPQFFNQIIDTVCSSALVTCDGTRTIRQAADIMSRHKCSSIFVRAANKNIVGVVTDNDLRQKVIARGLDTTHPVSKIMSAPLLTIPSKALVFEGLMAMMQTHIKHLAVIDANAHVVGVVTHRDLLSAQSQSPVFLVREIHMAVHFDQLIDTFNQVPQLIQNLIQSGAKAKNINRLITTISDAILEKIVRFTVDDTGPPPVRFAFMIMGSEGRQEQTLKTDQDNAIVYADCADLPESEVQDYFLRLGEKICSRLDRAGYAFCSGGVMAQNPKWCRPLSKWKDYFTAWIHAAGPEDLLHSSIFFDFRSASGDPELVAELREHLFRSLVGWEGFFRHLTENALRFKPPLGFFRNFVVASKGEHRNTLDIKSAMMPIVDFTRIYALKNRLEATNTLERLHQLWLNGVLSREEYDELDQAYSFLMQLRFVRQVTAAIASGDPPDNHINPKKLSGIEQKMLKEIFKRIEKFQQKLAFDFTGETGTRV